MIETASSILTIADSGAAVQWLTIFISNAIVASLIAAVAWAGSRLLLWPALWHVVWVIAIAKLFLPPIWTIPTTLFGDRLSSTRFARVTNIGSSTAQPEMDARVSRSLYFDIDAFEAAEPNESMHPETVQWRQWYWPNISVSIAILSFWILGSLSVLTRSSYGIVRFNGLVRRSAFADASTAALVESTGAVLCKSLRLPRVRLVDKVVPPLLWPIGRTATIVLPALWWQATTNDERRTVLMHELVHWRRRDHWVRVLQWIASIVFWWHPLVWIARGELHRLEEQCCDAEVMHRLPHAGRSYASALFSASQWLADRTDSSLPRCHLSLLSIPMFHPSQFKSFHRRIEMLPKQCYRPLTRRRWVAIFLFVAVPLTIGFGVHAQPTTVPQSPADSSSTKRNQSKLEGHVTDMAGNPIADATVRVVIPSGELRLPLQLGEHRNTWGKTDSTGTYSIVIDGIEKVTKASIDILHRGHRRLVGGWGTGGDPNEVTLVPGESSKFNAKLPESLYFAGQIVDQAGKPIEGVVVFSTLESDVAHGSVEQMITDTDGRFAVYSYEPFHFEDHPNSEQSTAVIGFYHDRYVYTSIEKLEALDPSKRDDLRVVMQSGYSIGGTVNNADGTPAGDVAISITQKEAYQARAVRTDDKGHFHFDGIGSGDARLRVVDVVGNQKSIQDLNIDASNTEMTVTLKPFSSPITTTHSLLGMVVADVTTALDEAYDLGTSKGVMIVDPGKRSDDFGIGKLRPGYVFRQVGNRSAGDLRTILSLLDLVRDTKSSAIPPHQEGNPSASMAQNGDFEVDVLYSYRDRGGHVYNTQQMRLTAKDIAELEKLRESLNTEP